MAQESRGSIGCRQWGWRPSAAKDPIGESNLYDVVMLASILETMALGCPPTHGNFRHQGDLHHGASRTGGCRQLALILLRPMPMSRLSPDWAQPPADQIPRANKIPISAKNGAKRAISTIGRRISRPWRKSGLQHPMRPQMIVPCRQLSLIVPIGTPPAMMARAHWIADRSLA